MNTFKLFFPFVIFTTLFGAGFWFACAGMAEQNRPIVPPISRIQTMSDLATLRVQIADTLVGKNEYWEISWMLHGEAVLGVDLSQATYASVDEEERELKLSLPAPHVISSKVDHHRSAEIAVKQNTLLPLPGRKSLRDEVWLHADEKVARLAKHDGYMEATKLQAERCLSNLLQELGWTATYEWQASADPIAMQVMLDRST